MGPDLDSPEGARRLAELFNEAMRLDPAAAAELLLRYVPCGPDVARAGFLTTEKDGVEQVRLLGVVNGMLDPKHRVIPCWDGWLAGIEFKVLDTSGWVDPS